MNGLQFRISISSDEHIIKQTPMPLVPTFVAWHFLGL
jgi:hypothetical protein